MTPWNHQRRGVDQVLAAYRRAIRRVCLTSPTGGGKTWMVEELLRVFVAMSRKAVVYSNRRMMVDQLHRSLESAGIRHGVRASDWGEDHDEPVQIASIQTETKRRKSVPGWKLHPADLVVIDECHLFTSKAIREILDLHTAAGAFVVGVTATPLDLDDIYDELVVAGCNSELRECGALVLAEHYAPDEPDLRHVKKHVIGDDLTESENVSAIMRHGVFGRVLEHWKRLNPDGKPTLLFAPGVAESRWFAEQFHAAGVPSAHIDGEEVWVNGESQLSGSEVRRRVLDMSRRGDIRVLCNRFVLREGIDCPWLAHGILATVFGSLQSYLQSGGRLLRAVPGLRCVTVQDHGGNWHRHGSLNDDRAWKLQDTSRFCTGGRIERLKAGTVREPIVCLECYRVITGRVCPCGHVLTNYRQVRPVIEADGRLSLKAGPIYPQRRTQVKADTARLWAKTYFQARNSRNRMSFSQALAWFCHQYGYYPPMHSRGLPLDPYDLLRPVKDVPQERLHS